MDKKIHHARTSQREGLCSLYFFNVLPLSQIYFIPSLFWIFVVLSLWKVEVRKPGRREAKLVIHFLFATRGAGREERHLLSMTQV